MGILLFILKLLGWVLLAALLLLVLLLILPLGIRFEYRRGAVLVKACYGPLRFTLWPRAKAEEPAKPQPKPTAADTAPPPQTQVKTVDGEKASVTVKVKQDAAPAPKKAAPTEKPPAAPADSKPTEKPPADTKKTLPFGISERIDAAMKLLSDDPMAFARCMLGHTGWLGRQFLRAIRVSRLDIFWTVTAPEASATAELYGAEMALANNLLAFLQQYIRIQSDRLWLEPDFTGQRAGERTVSFRLTSCLAVLLWLVLRLLHRLWKDPQLKPAAAKS